MISVTEALGGLNSIIARIREEAHEAAERTIAAAQESAESIIREAEAEAQRITAEAELKAQKMLSAAEERAGSAAEHRLAQGMLRQRQEILSEYISKAAVNIRSIGSDEYFGLCERFMRRCGKNAEGTLLMSESDIGAMPRSFKHFLKKEFPELEIEPSDRVSSGFIIKYGDIEENCTTEALIESSLDRIKEELYRQLFI